MSIKTGLKPLASTVVLAMVFNVQAAETTTTKIDSAQTPWAFDLMVYGWLSGMDGNFSAGRFNVNSDPGFISIMESLRNFPMAFSGRFATHYERFGFYLDGTYYGLDFEPKRDKGFSEGLEMRFGAMDYGASYRVLGDTAAKRLTSQDKSYSFDVYAGGRTIWLGNKASFSDVGSVSMDASVSMPVIGGRINADITPKWFVTVDGSVGGFGVDNVNFSSSALGSIGYRTSFFGVPTSMELGYKALSVKVSKPVLTSDITMHGLFLGLTGHW